MFDIPMQPVQSSNVESIGYDKDAQDLYVKFLNGSLYKYSAVPPSTFDNLLGAESVGKYLNSNIKPAHPFERIA